MISKVILMSSSLLVGSTALALLGDSVEVMVPWMMVMTAVILADLAAGVRKSLKLGVRVSPSTAFRETVGKWIVYMAYVLAVSMIDVEAGWNMYFAKWACLAAIAFEGGSIMSNLLRPYGIIVTPMSVIKWLLRKTPIGDTDEVLKEENIIEAREFEDKKWNTKKNVSTEKIVKPEQEDANEDGEARLQV